MLKRAIIGATAVLAALTVLAMPAVASASGSAARACSAAMSFDTPWHHSTTDVEVKTKARATVKVYVHYKTTTSHKAARANSAGHAVLPFNIGDATYGYRVRVDVYVREGAFKGSCSTSFIPTAVYSAGKCTSSGGYATCVEGGTANAPVRLYADVTSSPDQSTLVSWDMVCSKGLSAADSSGQFTAGTPILRLMKHPFSRPDSCIVSVDAQLNSSGSLTVKALYQK